MAASQRWPAFSLSLVLHIGAVGFFTWIDIAFPPDVPPRYEVLPAPDRKPDHSKIIWYKFRKTVPEVRPDHPFGPLPAPHGERDPSQTVVTLSPDALSTRQVILQPDNPQPLPADLPAPNMVALAVKLPPKVFVPPPLPDRPKTSEIAAIDAPPALDLPRTQTGNALGAIASLQKLPPKPFVAPPARGAGARVASHVDVPAPPSLDAQANQIPGLQAVIVGLNPGIALPPPGSRSAQIARAPEAGTPSSGANLATGAVVPGLLSHGKPGELPVPIPAPSIPERRAPLDVILPRVNRTMSAPLRPSSRMIPAAVEARFARRNVYALVIPRPALPGYGGDWVMWFAEHDPLEISSGQLISAPVPARKSSPVADDTDAQRSPDSATFQFAASIDRAGHIRSVTVLRGAVDPALRRRALEELGSWEFRPALRNGQPMDVDIVLEIPFRFAPSGPATR